jgi:enediyne biosynthesis protein E4
VFEGYTLNLVVQDLDGDGWPDIYLSDDFLSNDILYMNNGDGTFSNRVGDYFKHTTFAGMGSDIADFNNDGRPDIFVLDMTPEHNLRQKSMLISMSYENFRKTLSAGYYVQYNRNTLQLNNGMRRRGTSRSAKSASWPACTTPTGAGACCSAISTTAGGRM